MAEIKQKGTLIVTLELATEDQAFFNKLRKAHFPAHANYIEAHITLFHKLPGNEPAIPELLSSLANIAPITLQVANLQLMGHCVAYRLESEALQTFHLEMQQAFAPWLIRQDQQPLRPHITIQNKVTMFKAQQLYQQLSQDFIPFMVTATGLKTWKYLHGPWKALDHFAFHKAANLTME